MLNATVILLQLPILGSSDRFGILAGTVISPLSCSVGSLSVLSMAHTLTFIQKLRTEISEKNHQGEIALLLLLLYLCTEWI